MLSLCEIKMTRARGELPLHLVLDARDAPIPCMKLLTPQSLPVWRQAVNAEIAVSDAAFAPCRQWKVPQKNALRRLQGDTPIFLSYNGSAAFAVPADRPVSRPL